MEEKDIERLCVLQLDNLGAVTNLLFYDNEPEKIKTCVLRTLALHERQGKTAIETLRYLVNKTNKLINIVRSY